MRRRALTVAGLALAHAALAYLAMATAALGGAVRIFTGVPPSLAERVAEPAARVLLLPLVRPLLGLARGDAPEWLAIGVFLANSLIWGVALRAGARCVARPRTH